MLSICSLIRKAKQSQLLRINHRGERGHSAWLCMGVQPAQPHTRGGRRRRRRRRATKTIKYRVTVIGDNKLNFFFLKEENQYRSNDEESNHIFSASRYYTTRVAESSNEAKSLQGLHLVAELQQDVAPFICFICLDC